MAAPTTQEFLEVSAELHSIEIVPAPVGVDLYTKMADIASQHGLRKHLKGSFTELSANGKRFTLKFDHPIAAHTFMMHLNQEPESEYTAVKPETPVGLGEYTLIERIS